MTEQQKTLTPPNAPKRKIGLALAGGGPLAAVYEIGVLAALEESIEGLDVNDAEIYVGISAGGIIAAALANGITPHQMCRLFIESDVEAADGGALFKPEILLRPASAELRKRAAMLPGLLLSGMLHYARHRSSVFSSFERLKEALPAGILSGEGIHRYMRSTFARGGRTNDFRKLRNKLVIVATDLDTGEAVRFGEKGWDSTPISKAVQASAAVPGLFPPVEIDGHHFVRASGGEAVGSGQVDQFKFHRAVNEPALLHLDRDAGIVTHLLTEAGKSIKQGRFPGVRVPHQRHFDFQ